MALQRSKPDWDKDETWLADIAVRCGVPGASLAILRDGRVQAMATGYANRPEEITADINTVFHVGSITKAFTATVAMKLADRGAFDLDTPVVELLPEWETACRAQQDRMRVRHLLNHTSGLDGDQLLDTGRGADCLARLIDECAGMRFLHEPGALFSYCNFGYLLLGRIVERVLESSWDEALRIELTDPLGLSSAVVLPDLLLRHRVALGHIGNVGSGDVLAPLWPRSNAASGARLAMTATDLLSFARMHLSDGKAASGAQLLSPESTALMRMMSVATPYSRRYTGWGLGWMNFDWGQGVYGHDGGVAGMSAYLRIFPRQNAAMALMINGGNAALMSREVISEAARALAGVETLPSVPSGDLTTIAEAGRFVGRYVRNGLELQVRWAEGGLELTTGGDYEDAPATYRLWSFAPDTFALRLPDLGINAAVHFSGLEADGRTRFAHLHERAFRRLDD